MRASTSVVFALGHRRCTLAIDRPSAVSSIFVILKFKRAHLQIYGIWSQASQLIIFPGKGGRGGGSNNWMIRIIRYYSMAGEDCLVCGWLWREQC